MFEVEQVIQQKMPLLQQHAWLHKPTVACLRSLLCERRIKAFAAQYPQLHGLEFVEHVLDFFHFTYSARDAEKDNIASHGRLIIVANHPIGSLDGLALLKLISEVRSDVKVLANDMLMAVKPLQELLIPVAVFGKQGNSTILRELGRLREIAFRAVDEGTGRRRDLDNYDTWYQHLLLWSPRDLEIAGAYRLGDCAAIRAQHGVTGLYTHSLFRYDERMERYFNQGLELGRSFVQPRYWGRRSLEYLWQGIGALLRRQPHYRYLFGPVTLSGALPQQAKDATMQVAIPTLYKQYADLCEPGGVRFLAFNVDADFADAIDGLVMVDMAQLKPAKRARYIDAGEHS